ncbi:hypothetical protein Tco_0080230 [Tanacetum coccineum]
MMRYLKHVGGKKHSDLKTKIFKEIQVLYEKVKSEKENDELGLCLTIALDEDKEVDYEILDKKYSLSQMEILISVELNQLMKIKTSEED